MTANYEKEMYNQLIDVMARLDSFEKKYDHDISHLNSVITDLTKENTELRKKNKILMEDNARLKSIINNDSSNTSLPPSSNQKTDRKDKSDKPANSFNGREKTDKKASGHKGHKGTTLSKEEVETKIKDGKCSSTFFFG